MNTLSKNVDLYDAFESLAKANQESFVEMRFYNKISRTKNVYKN